MLFCFLIQLERYLGIKVVAHRKRWLLKIFLHFICFDRYFEFFKNFPIWNSMLHVSYKVIHWGLCIKLCLFHVGVKGIRCVWVQLRASQYIFNQHQCWPSTLSNFYISAPLHIWVWQPWHWWYKHCNTYWSIPSPTEQWRARVLNSTTGSHRKKICPSVWVAHIKHGRPCWLGGACSLREQ